MITIESLKEIGFKIKPFKNMCFTRYYITNNCFIFIVFKDKKVIESGLDINKNKTLIDFVNIENIKNLMMLKK